MSTIGNFPVDSFRAGRSSSFDASSWGIAFFLYQFRFGLAGFLYLVGSFFMMRAT
jgi:hypothetical protein